MKAADSRRHTTESGRRGRERAAWQRGLLSALSGLAALFLNPAPLSPAAMGTRWTGDAERTVGLVRDLTR